MKKNVFMARFGWLVRQEMASMREWRLPAIDAELHDNFFETYLEVAEMAFNAAFEGAADDADADADKVRQFVWLVIDEIGTGLKSGATIEG